MSFAVEDFRDLLQLLRERPEWKAELRREILGDELLELPDLVRENTRAIAELRSETAENTRAIAELRAATGENTRAIAELREAIAELRTETAENTRAIAELREAITELRSETAENTRAIAELREAIAELRSETAENTRAIAELRAATEENTRAIAELREAVSDLRATTGNLRAVTDELQEAVNVLRETMERGFARVDNEIGDLKGLILEVWFADRPGLAVKGLRRPRRVDAVELDDLVDGSDLDEEEADSLRLTDLILAGRDGRGDDARDVRIAVEVSNVIDRNDVERAIQRSLILGRLGAPARAAVAGQSILPDATELAEESGVAVAIRAFARH